MQEAPLEFSGTTSVYEGGLKAQESGEFTLRVLAMDPSNVNFGWVKSSLTVR